MLLLLVVLSALDIAQFVLGGESGGSDARSAGYAATMFRVDLPLGTYAVGFVDLLLISAIAEHARRRGRQLPLIVAPGVVGFLLADVVVAGGARSGLPLIPFLCLGWLTTEAAHAHARRR